MTAKDLLDTLDDLGEDEYNRFRWSLQQVQNSKGVIRKGHLEKANKWETVDLLLQTYGHLEAVEVTKQVLKEIPRNDLVQRLSVAAPPSKVFLSVGDAEVADTMKKKMNLLLRPKSPVPSIRPKSSSSSSSSPTADTDFPPTFPSPTTSSPPVSCGVLPSPPLSPDICKTGDLMIPVPEPQSITFYQEMLQSNLLDRFMYVQEGWTGKKDEQSLHDVFTELSVTTGGDVHINSEHEVVEIGRAENFEGIETSVNLSNIFTSSFQKHKPIRNLVTSGLAGIGKTFLVHKFILEWTDRKAHQDIQLLFPFNFRHLNSLKGQKLSLAELIHECIPETKGISKAALNYIFTTIDASGNTNYDRSEFKLLFVLDGLDECRLNLNLKATDNLPFDLTTATKPTVVLRKLINRKLLRSARIWVITRPAGTNQIPQVLIDRMTEVRGFNDLQKEDYFKKRFKDEQQARAIISHIKASRSIHIMCHIPVFSWIIATVLEEVLKKSKDGELPNTLTEMYTEFLVFQIVQMKAKWGPERSMQSIQALAKLAFEQLEKSSLTFYEKDLKGIGIDVTEVSAYSGVFTEVFKEELGRRKEEVRMFSFVHASVQEFLAAVHVRMSLVLRNKNVMSMHIGIKSLKHFVKKTSTTKIHKIAIDKTLQSPNGHLDLFLRFLLGLSLENNNDKLQVLLEKKGTLKHHQFLLQRLLTDTDDGLETNEETIKYIKKKIGENLSTERNINLFHCLNELNDRSLVEDIQQYLSSDSFNTDQLTASQWSALVFILLTSEEDLDVFELKKFSAKEDAFLKLLPVVKASKKALLGCCTLTQRSCKGLSSVLISPSCSLKELDLSGNELEDSGVKELCSGLESPHCKLENVLLNCCKLSDRSTKVLAGVINSSLSCLRNLDLSYNNLQDSGVKFLSSALQSPKCSLESLSLSGCNLSDKSGELLSSVLSSETSSLTKLSLSNNRLQDSGLKSLLAGFLDSNCILKTLCLSDCLLTRQGFINLASALNSNPSNIRELDLSYNHPEQSGMKALSEALENPQCSLDTLRLSGCYLSESYCEALSTILSSQSSTLRELDLSYNDLQDSGVKLLSTPLGSPNCKLKILRLCGTNLFRKSCKALSSVLSCHSSSLTEIDLSNNDLQDSGVKLLSEGLRSSHRKLEILRLSGCQITEEGCLALVSALKSHPFNLKEIDLSYNHPGDSELKLLSAIGDPLRIDYGGQQRLNRGLKKYACELTLDTNTVNKHLQVVDNDKKVIWADEKQACEDHPDRFDHLKQILCSDGLTGRCYWEVEWEGQVEVAVAYGTLRRKGKSSDCKLGENNHSWSLSCAGEHYTLCHNNVKTDTMSFMSVCNKVAVYVDCPAGTLSFYRANSDPLVHLYTFRTTFTGPLYPAFGLHPDSTLALC